MMEPWQKHQESKVIKVRARRFCWVDADVLPSRDDEFLNNENRSTQNEKRVAAKVKIRVLEGLRSDTRTHSTGSICI